MHLTYNQLYTHANKQSAHRQAHTTTRTPGPPPREGRCLREHAGDTQAPWHPETEAQAPVPMRLNPTKHSSSPKTALHRNNAETPCEMSAPLRPKRATGGVRGGRSWQVRCVEMQTQTSAFMWSSALAGVGGLLLGLLHHATSRSQWEDECRR